MNFNFGKLLGRWGFAAGLSMVLLSAGVFSVRAAGSGRQKLHGYVPAAVGSLRAVRTLPAMKQLHLTLGLPLQHQPELDALLHQIYDPGSTNFHKYLTPQEFTARFGPSESDYAALLEFVRTNGFQIVATHPNRVLVDVTGTAATVERVFDVTLRDYRHPHEARDFYAPDTEPSVTAPVTLLNVSGLNNFSLPHPNLKPRPRMTQSVAKPNVGSGPGGAYLGNDFRAAYVPGTPLTGAGQSVGLLQFDGYHSSDIADYIAQAGITTSVLLTNVPINGGVPTPGSGEVEVCLDIEMAIAMAPGLDKIIVYEAPNGGTAWSTILSRMANDNLAKQLSCSWGGGSPDATSEQIFKQMAAQGQSFFNATGDSDAFTGAIPFPSESTNITQVGGTTLSTAGAGGSYDSETTWNWGGGTGSSGGVSTYYKIPSWQTNLSMTANGGSTTYRNVPDVALTGDNVYVTQGNGSSQTVGGTSCAAPLWAGYCALINQQAGLAARPAVGFLNPALYALANTASYNDNFHDITTGNNTSPSSASQYYAVAGYDLCTGLGTPNGTNLINALAPLVFAPSVASGGWTLQTESATPTNGVIDPGETVTVGFALQNSGNLPTGNLIATLQTNAGVLAPSGSQSYGALTAFGGVAEKPFTFTTAGMCGSNIVATLTLQDGTSNLGTVNFTLPLGNSVGLSQNFDAVIGTGLPANWTTVTVSGDAANWVASTVSSDSAPNAAFIADPVSAGQNALVSPVIPIRGTNAYLAFRQNYSLEYAGNGVNRTFYDGALLEIQLGDGAFTDILTAGGSFVAGGYNRIITTSSDNPLGGRSAWCGSSSGWTSAVVKLPASAAGQNIHLRWNCATDNGNAGGPAVGWYVDTISLTDGAASCLSVLADLSVGQSLAANSSTPGENLVYTLGVTNLGPQPAANVVLMDALPANVTFISASPGCTYSAGKIVCPAGMLAVGDFTNVTVTLAPAGEVTFTNLISASTVTPEFSAANNTAVLVVTQVVPTPAGISNGPVSQEIQCGSNAAFLIVPTGTPPLGIQWSLDGSPVAAGTNTSLLLTNVHLPDHNVSVTVTNLYGTATSNALLAVSDTLPPVITLNGSNPFYVELGGAFVDPGATAGDACAGSLAVVTTGLIDPNFIGTNTLTYSADDGNGNTNSASRTVIVRDTAPPTIWWSFTNLVLAADTNCSAAMPDVTGTNFILADDLSEPLVISQTPTNTAVLPLGTNVIIVTIADAFGNAAYSTNCLVILDASPPVVVIQPQSQTNHVGDNTSFTIAATACSPVACQWFFQDKILDGATNSILALTNLQSIDAGDYFALAASDGGLATSAVVSLTILLTNNIVFTNNGVALTLAGVPGQTYILETTTNLLPAVWLPVDTNALGTNGLWQFCDPAAASFPQRFYRLKEAP